MHAQALIMYLQPSSEATLHRSAGNVAAHTKALRVFHRQKELFPPGLEPGTFRVLGERDNHYTTETCFTDSKNASYSRAHAILPIHFPALSL